MISEVLSSSNPSLRAANSLRKRLRSGIAIGGFGAVVVLLGGWWLTLGVGVIVHLGLLEFFRMAQFKGIRPATKTTLVACQLLLLTTHAKVSTRSIASCITPGFSNDCLWRSGGRMDWALRNSAGS